MESQLVHFTYTEFLFTTGNYGPSSVRRYRSTTLVEPQIPREMGELGKALGLHGFATITAIETSDGSGRHYIEADARPNIWSERGEEVGDCPVDRIRHWFDRRQSMLDRGTLMNSDAPGPEVAVDRTLVAYQRLPRVALLTNRHDVWRQIPWRRREVAYTVPRKIATRRTEDWLDPETSSKSVPPVIAGRTAHVAELVNSQGPSSYVPSLSVIDGHRALEEAANRLLPLIWEIARAGRRTMWRQPRCLRVRTESST